MLDRLRNGAAGLLIEGDPGIGKTTIWRSAVGSAAACGCRVLRCVGEQTETRLSLVGLSDLIGDGADGVISSLPSPHREALEGALLDTDATRAVDARAVGVALRAVLVRLASAGPVVVAIDDAQWLDGATAAVVAFAARRLERHPVAVLATVRAPVPSGDLLGLGHAFAPGQFSRLRLGPLDLRALRQLLEHRLGHPYRRPELGRIAQASNGNPLLALELARALDRTPSLDPGAPLPVPDTLRELVRTRLAEVPAPARDALLAAAALSRPSPDLVEQASSVAGLAAAEEAGVLRVEGGRVIFEHPLYASAVYSAAPSRRRTELHRQLATLVVDPEERARHLALSATPPDEEIASALESAALHARRRGAWDGAAELLEKARSFTPRSRPELGGARAVHAAEHYVHAGDRTRARVLLEDALDQPLSEPTRLDALRLLAEIHYNEDSFGEARRRLEEALEHCRHRSVSVGLRLALSFVHTAEPDFLGADLQSAAALDEARSLGDAAVLAEALAVRAMINCLVGRGIDWAAVERALELEDSTRVLPLTMRPSLIAALLMLYDGRLTEAGERLRALCDTAKASGDESDLAVALDWLSWLTVQTGDFVLAALLADEAVASATLTGSRSGLAWALGVQTSVHAHRGEMAAARARAAEASTICRELGFWQPELWVSSGIGLLELSLGNPDAAWAAVRRLTEVSETHPPSEPHMHQHLPTALEALIALGQLDRARRLLDWFEAQAQQVDRSWALVVAHRSRGILLAAEGDPEGAERALERALADLSRIEMPFERARTLLVRGQVRRRRRQKRSARESLEQALSLFESLGSPLWAERTRAELARLGSRPSADELTPSERHAAELAASGHSNKEIAADLFISVHTVEQHLSHAYAKLDVRSRSQLARALDRRQ